MTKEDHRQAESLKPIGDAGIRACRKIVAEGQFGKVNDVVVDVFSASALIAVYDKLNEKNQATMRGLPVAKACAVALKLIK